jgi:TonB-dependent SusC/RagA subfamily outer membrane receptor
MRKGLRQHSAQLNKLFFIIPLFFSITAFSQIITGTVTDENKKPIGSVTVQVKGTSRASLTNDAGKYSIDASGSDVLVFSSIGFIKQEVPTNGKPSLDVTLASDTRSMDEVTVTALGISKKSRGLGYAATNVKPEELTVNRTPNPINALEGKVAGVNITSLGTGPGGSSKIRIRGQSAITVGDNSPLIVVNGVPINSGNFNASTVGVTGGGVYSDGGDSYSSINPDDIESMTILKGAPAAALYGSRAANGVIMITTKTRARGKGIGVSLNSNYTYSVPVDYTDYQKVYGQGENGVRPKTSNPTSGQWSFGEKIQPGMTQVLFDSLTVPYVAQDSRIKEFYRNGQDISNTVTMETSGDKGGLHVSLNNTDNYGITPNNKFNRKMMNLGFNSILSNSFSFGGNVNYSRQSNHNPPNIANQDNSIPTTLMAMANTMPLSVLESKKYNAQGNEYVYSRFMNRTNPYWVLAEQFHNINTDRIYGNVFGKYNILSWWWIQGRFWAGLFFAR